MRFYQIFNVKKKRKEKEKKRKERKKERKKCLIILLSYFLLFPLLGRFALLNSFVFFFMIHEANGTHDVEVTDNTTSIRWSDRGKH